MARLEKELREEMKQENPVLPSTEPTIDGIPMDAYVAQEQELRKSGMTMLYGDSGLVDDKTLGLDGMIPYKGSIYNPDTQGFVDQGEVADSVPLTKPSEALPLFPSIRSMMGMDNAYDFETAMIEVGLEGKPEEFEKRYEQNKMGRSNLKSPNIENVGNEVLYHFRQLQEAGELDNKVALLTQEELNTLDDSAKLRYLNDVFAKIDSREASNRLFYALALARKYGPHVSVDAVDAMDQELLYEHQQGIIQGLLKESHDDLRQEVDRFVATQGWDSFAQAVVDASVQELVPIQNVGLKIAFLGKMAEYIGMNPEDLDLNLGDRRRQIREWIAKEGPAQVLEGLKQFHKWLESEQKGSSVYRQYLILEQYEAIFSEELLSSNNPEDHFDEFFGTFETAMEAVAGAWLITRAVKGTAKGLKSTFRATDKSVLNRAARASGNREAQAEMDRIVQGKIAENLDIDPGEAALNLMPRPSQLVDERTVVLPGVSEAVERGEKLTEKIIDASRGSLSRVFTASEKNAIAASEIDALKLGDNARVAPAMSTMEVLEDGVRIRAVITKSGDEAYKGLDELAIDLSIIDPAMDKLTVLRRGANGKLERVEIDAEELRSIVDSNPIMMTDDQLEAAFDVANKEGRQWQALTLEREIARREGTQSVSAVLEDEYFLEFDHFRAYHPMDKVAFGDGAGAFRSTLTPLRVINSPNGKYVGDISEATMQAARDEARIDRLFGQLYRPFYSLTPESQRAVGNVFEWSEAEARALGRDTTLAEIITEFPQLTQKELEGVIAVRQGMDAQYTVLNRRLWREYNGLGYKSAMPKNPDMPAFHGKLDELDDMAPGTYYDPTSQSLVTLNKADIEALKVDGARTMTLDTTIDIPGTRGAKKADRILVLKEDYDVGKLAHEVLERYPGYRFRFYEDPYYIIRKTEGVEVNGVKRTQVTEEAMKTSGSQREAEAYLNRGRFKRTVNKDGVPVWKDKHGAEYLIVASKQLDSTDAALRQREVLRTEGRLFWDKRNQQQLKNTAGNDAELMDFSKALDNGTSLVTRQNTHEDMLRALKNALLTEYKLPELTGINANTKSIKEVVEDLKTAKNNLSGNPALQKKYAEAISLAKYIRQLEGVDSKFLAGLRSKTLSMIHWVDTMAGERFGLKPGKLGWAERIASTMDPLGRMRKINFGTFMVLRAGRQLLLQASQPLFLAGIDPVYVMSGKGLKDTLLLRNTMMKLAKVDFDDGMNLKTRAKLMGLSESELKTLARRLEKSGIVDVVDLHSFAGGARAGKALSSESGVVRRSLSGVYNKSKQFGFDLGEEINKVATFNIAWRRVMKKNGYTSLKQLTEDDWLKVADDTENLSFAMNKAGAFQYQSGALSLATQFMSFSHKYMLALLFQNPALSTKETMRIWAGMFALYGGGMWGLREETVQSMYSLGYDETWLNQEVAPGISAIDVLSAGVIQTMGNAIGNLTSKDYKDMDFASIGPTFDVQQFTGLFLEGILDGGLGVAAVPFGPFANRASNWEQAAEFTRLMTTGYENLGPVDKAVRIADMVMKKTFPQYNDATLAYLAYKFDKQVSSNGSTVQTKVSSFNALMRGVFGVRTLEEEIGWELISEGMEYNELQKDLIQEGRRFINQQIQLYREGEITYEDFMDAARLAGEIANNAPFAMREAVIKGIMSDDLGDDPTNTPINNLGKMVEEFKLDPNVAKRMLRDLDPDDERRETLESFIDELYEPAEHNVDAAVENLIKRNTR